VDEDWAVGHLSTDLELWMPDTGISLADFRIGVITHLVETYTCLNLPEVTICLYTEEEDEGYRVYAEGYCFSEECIEASVLGLDNEL